MVYQVARRHAALVDNDMSSRSHLRWRRVVRSEKKGIKIHLSIKLICKLKLGRTFKAAMLLSSEQRQKTKL